MDCKLSKCIAEGYCNLGKVLIQLLLNYLKMHCYYELIEVLKTICLPQQLMPVYRTMDNKFLHSNVPRG